MSTPRVSHNKRRRGSVVRPKVVFLQFETSDGTSDLHGELNGPQRDMLDSTPDEHEAQNYMRLVENGEKKYLDWLKYLGESLVKHQDPGGLGKDLKNNRVIIFFTSLPAGYRLYEHIRVPGRNGGKPRKDTYLYGHPKGPRKRYRSPNEFWEHVLWLSTDVMKNPANCRCRCCESSAPPTTGPTAVTASSSELKPPVFAVPDIPLLPTQPPGLIENSTQISDVVQNSISGGQELLKIGSERNMGIKQNTRQASNEIIESRMLQGLQSNHDLKQSEQSRQHENSSLSYPTNTELIDLTGSDEEGQHYAGKDTASEDLAKNAIQDLWSLGFNDRALVQDLITCTEPVDLTGENSQEGMELLASNELGNKTKLVKLKHKSEESSNNTTTISRLNTSSEFIGHTQNDKKTEFNPGEETGSEEAIKKMLEDADSFLVEGDFYGGL